MPYTARSLEYFYTALSTRTDDAFELLDNLANHDINFLAVTLVPMGPDSTQLTLFPEEASLLQSVANRRTRSHRTAQSRSCSGRR